MSIQEDIEQALIDRIKAIAPFVPVLTISYDNLDFDIPSNNSRYLELKHFPNPPANYAWGTGKHYSGTFRVAVVDPLKLGTIEVVKICDTIVEWFADATKLTNGNAVVHINGEPTLQTMLFDNTRQVAIFPIMIGYHCNG